MRASAPIAVLLALAVLAGCGGKTDQQQVRDKIQEFATALGKRDYQSLCDDVFAPSLVAKLGTLGLPCEEQLRQSLAPVRKPTVSVKRVVITGKTAKANVVSGAAGQRPSADVIGLTKTKHGWRISSRSTPRR